MSKWLRSYHLWIWLITLSLVGGVSFGSFSRSSTSVQGANEVATVPAGWPLDVAWDGVFTRRLLVDGAGALVTASSVSGGTVTANQGTPNTGGVLAWPVTASQNGAWTVTANQGTSPWVVSGTVTANQGTSPWVTSVSNFPATQPVSGTVTANQGTTPWTVAGAAANGAALSGNPVLIAGSDGTNAKNLQVESNTQSALRISVYSGGTQAPVVTAGDANSNATGLVVVTRAGAFNGSTFDRIRTVAATPALTGVQSVAGNYAFGHLAANATTTLKSGSELFHTISIN